MSFVNWGANEGVVSAVDLEARDMAVLVGSKWNEGHCLWSAMFVLVVK